MTHGDASTMQRIMTTLLRGREARVGMVPFRKGRTMMRLNWSRGRREERDNFGEILGLYKGFFVWIQ